MLYFVAEFHENGKATVAIIPENWKHGTKCCLWQPYQDHKIDSAAKESEVPGETWRAFPIRRLLYETGR